LNSKMVVHIVNTGLQSVKSNGTNPTNIWRKWHKPLFVLRYKYKTHK